jgi:hypothetical protein
LAQSEEVQCPHKRIGERPCINCAPKEHEMEGKLGLLRRKSDPTWRLFDSTFDTIDEIREFFNGYKVEPTEEFLIFTIMGGVKYQEDDDE